MKYFLLGSLSLLFSVSALAQTLAEPQYKITIKETRKDGNVKKYVYHLSRQGSAGDTLHVFSNLKEVSFSYEPTPQPAGKSVGEQPLFKHIALDGWVDSNLTTRLQELRERYAAEGTEVQVISFRSDSLQRSINNLKEELGSRIKEMDMKVLQVEDFDELNALDAETKSLLSSAGVQLPETEKIVVIKFAHDALSAGSTEVESGSITSQKSVRVYPNPTASTLTLSFSNISDEPIQLSVTDLQGRLVLEQEFKPTGGVLEEELNLPAGRGSLYILTFTQGQKKWQQKITLQ